MEYPETIDPSNEPSANKATNEGATPSSEVDSQATKSTENKAEPIKKYQDLEITGLIEAATVLLQGKEIPQISDQMKQITALFESKFQEVLKQEKDSFISGGGNEIDFYFNPPYKKQWDQVSYEFRQKRRKHYRDLEESQKVNLERRRQIIEEIKNLIGSQDNINSVYNQFRALRESWHKCGSVPRSESNNVWETYKHHVERFYDFLHLNRELRELDFKHNYEKKLKIIEQAEVLAQSDNIVKASRDLNTLHRQWKNDLGPVAREHREDLWKRFQAATKIIHDKRHDYEKNIDQFQQQNLEKRQQLIQAMEELIEKKAQSHKAWQQLAQKFNALRTEFQNTGQVPKAESKLSWNQFRELGRQFNRSKNDFYKNQKKVQKQAIDQRKELIQEVKKILELEDWDRHSQRVKNLQNQWKKIGFIPRKIGDALWDEFRQMCNLYFERLRGDYLQLSPQEEGVHQAQLALIETVAKVDIPADAAAIQDYFLDLWKTCQTSGDLNKSAAMKNGQAFIKAVEKRIQAAPINSSEKELIQFEIRLMVFGNWGDTLIEEMTQVKGQIDQLKTERTQLENNLEFFSNASAENPLVKEVTEKSAALTEKIEALTDRFKRLKQAQHKLHKSEANSEDDDNLEEETE